MHRSSSSRLPLVWVVIVCLLLHASSAVAATLSSYDKITSVDPQAITNLEANQTITIVGARRNDWCFLMYTDQNLHMTTNCSHPPSLTSGLRTPTVNVTNASTATFDVSNLQAGTYLICFRGSFKMVNSSRFALVSAYTALSAFPVTVGGPVNTDLSEFSCCGPFVAGTSANCTVFLRDDFGYLTGSASTTACQFTLCPLRDGRGAIITNMSGPTMIRPGVFLFHFIPEGSGCDATAGVKYGGMPLANKQAFFSVAAGPPASNASTSSCEVLVNGTTVCAITQRDTYGNAIQRCVYNSDGGPVVCTVIN
jgi:hypothetical protein